MKVSPVVLTLMIASRDQLEADLAAMEAGEVDGFQPHEVAVLQRRLAAMSAVISENQPATLTTMH